MFFFDEKCILGKRKKKVYFSVQHRCVCFCTSNLFLCLGFCEKMSLSEEQDSIVSYMSAPRSNPQTSRSCMVNAFAGTGKSHTLLQLAKKRFEMGMGMTLILTYSKELKSQMRILAQGCDGILVESVHALVKNHLNLNSPCHTDEHIDTYLACPNKPSPHPAFLQNVTLVAMDEIQDLSERLYRVLQQMRSFFLNGLDFIGVGDFFQWLFATINASDVKYMMHPQLYFPTDEFASFRLTKSYRMMPQVCDWINQHLSPLTLELHYPECWSKYGTKIKELWGDGLKSARCRSCGQVEHPQTECTQPPISNADVTCIEHDTYKEYLVPSVLQKNLVTGRALLIINGLNLDRFTKKFHKVTTPEGFKGCETQNAYVLGCDRFVEVVMGQQGEHLTTEDWPLQCFCKMYVSCTRARDKLVVVRSKGKNSFFTMRNSHSVLPIPTPETATVQGPRPLARLFHFVPDDSKLDNCVHADTVLAHFKAPFRQAPNSVPGTVPHTVVTPFAHYYHQAVRLALFLKLTLSPDEYKSTVHKKWTEFMRKHILHDHNKFVSESWKADESWCDTAVLRGVKLLQDAGFATYDTEGKHGVLTVEKFGAKVEHMKLQSTIDFVFRWHGVVAVSFFGDETSDAVKKFWHQAFASYLCFGETHKKQYVGSCCVMDVVGGTVKKLQCNVGMQEDQYLSDLVRRKKWDFLLPKKYTFTELMWSGNAVPLDKLEKEREKRREQILLDFNKRVKLEDMEREPTRVAKEIIAKLSGHLGYTVTQGYVEGIHSKEFVFENVDAAVEKIKGKMTSQFKRMVIRVTGIDTPTHICYQLF